MAGWMLAEGARFQWESFAARDAAVGQALVAVRSFQVEDSARSKWRPAPQANIRTEPMERTTPKIFAT